MINIYPAILLLNHTLHNFDASYQDVSIVTIDLSGGPRLHPHQVTLFVNGGNDSLPRRGVFDWH